MVCACACHCLTYTGAVGLFRCTRAGSSSSSEGSESGFPYIGRSSDSESELSLISSIDMIFELAFGGLVSFVGTALLVTGLDLFPRDIAEDASTGLRSLIKPIVSSTFVRFVYHCPSGLFSSSAVNFILLSSVSTSSDTVLPSTMPKKRARGEDAASRFDIAFRYMLD